MKLVLYKRRMLYNLILVQLFLLVLISIIQSSLLVYRNIKIANYIYFLGIVLRVGMAVSCLIETRITKKEMSKTAALLSIILVSYITIGGYTFFDLFFAAVIIGKYMDYKKITNLFFYSTLMGTGIVISLYFIGYLPKFTVFRYGTNFSRNSYGFSHPNVCGRFLFSLCLLYILKRRNKLGFVELIGMTLIAYWVYVYPNSVTASLMIIGLVTCLLVIKLYKLLFKREIISNVFVKIIGIAVIPIIFITVFYLVLNSQSHSVLQDLSATFYSRFTGGLSAMQQYPIRLLGNKISFTTYSQIYFGATNDNYFVIDCLYILLPVKYGIIATIYFSYQLYKGAVTSIKRNDSFLFLAIIFLLVYSLAENGLSLIYFSYIFLLTYAREFQNG